jgi:hypothetical protein
MVPAFCDTPVVAREVLIRAKGMLVKMILSQKN